MANIDSISVAFNISWELTVLYSSSESIKAHGYNVLPRTDQGVRRTLQVQMKKKQDLLVKVLCSCVCLLHTTLSVTILMHLWEQPYCNGKTMAVFFKAVKNAWYTSPWIHTWEGPAFLSTRKISLWLTGLVCYLMQRAAFYEEKLCKLPSYTCKLSAFNSY